MLVYGYIDWWRKCRCTDWEQHHEAPHNADSGNATACVRCGTVLTFQKVQFSLVDQVSGMWLPDDFTIVEEPDFATERYR